MNLVVAKIQRIKSFIYRNTEYVKGLPHCKRGEPDREIRRTYMPWIFQTVPGSYQFFLVSVQVTNQSNASDVNLLGEQIMDKSFDILQVCAESPEASWPAGQSIRVGSGGADWRPNALYRHRG